MLLVLLAALTVSAVAADPFGAVATTLYSFSSLNFTFRSQQDTSFYQSNLIYEVCTISGLKVTQQGDYIVSIPRSYSVVSNSGQQFDKAVFIPATLARIVPPSDNSQAPPFMNPLLEPFPSWDYQTVGLETALQSVVAFEIDGYNRLWALDSGRIGSQPAAVGAAKLLIFNLSSSPVTLLQNYTFPPNIVLPNSSFLTELVVDVLNDKAIIADAGSVPVVGLPGQIQKTYVQAAMIVYDFETNTARRVLDSRSVVQDDLGLTITVNSEPVFTNLPVHLGVYSLALCQSDQKLRFAALSSFHLYTVDVGLLYNESVTDDELVKQIVMTTFKDSVSSSLTCSYQNVLYRSVLEMNKVKLYDFNVVPPAEAELLDSISFAWGSSFGFDHKGFLVFVSNSLNKFLEHRVDFYPTNTPFKIWSVFVNSDSYAAVNWIPIPPTSAPTAPPPTIGPDTPDAGRAEIVQIVLICMLSLIGATVLFLVFQRVKRELFPKPIGRQRAQDRQTLSAAVYAAAAGSTFQPISVSRPSTPGAGLASLATPTASVYSTPVRGDEPLYQGGYQSIP